MPLVSLTDVKTFLGVSDVSEDTSLTQLIQLAEQTITNYVGQKIEAATYTEYYSGDGSRLLALRHRPVRSIISIRIDSAGSFGHGPGAFPPETELSPGSGYALVLDYPGENWSKSGLVERVGTVWPRIGSIRRAGNLAAMPANNYGNIRVIYDAGWPVIPHDIQLAVMLLVSQFRLSRLHGGMVPTSESLGGYSYSLGDPGSGASASGQAAIGSARQLLAPYRNVPIGMVP